MIGFGANLGDPACTLDAAVLELGELGRVRGVSPAYRSAPIGPQDQPDFHNSVIELDTRRSPGELLHALQAIERRHGRVRGRRFGPRTIDLDLLWFEGVTCDHPRLTLPHPRAHEREFVLRPLCDLDPGLVLRGRTAAEWLAELPPQGVRPVDGDPDGA